jgi:hypothetical protein
MERAAGTDTHNKGGGEGPEGMMVRRGPETQPLEAGKYEVLGELADADLRELEALVARLTADPILLVRVVRPGVVEVKTGVIRGPLAGGGRFFDFEKQDGRWTPANTNEVRLWKS